MPLQGCRNPRLDGRCDPEHQRPCREGVSCRIDVSWQMPDARGELCIKVQVPGLPRGVFVWTGEERKRESRDPCKHRTHGLL